MKSSLHKALFASLVVLLLVSAVYPSGRRLPSDTLRVAFLTSQKRIHVKSVHGFVVFDLENSGSKEFEGEVNFVLSPHDGEIMVGSGANMGPQIRIVPVKEKEFIRINGRRYRGTVVVINAGRDMTAINEVDVESYLKGVLPMEISPRWPMEAIKAQAVASRTYAVNNLGKYADDGYDLTADVFSQVYGAVEAEDPRSNRAVEETEGEVLVYEGELARAYFHSSCGGHTEDIRHVWSSDIPYLRGRYSPYCSDSPRARWELELTPGQLQESMNAAGFAMGKVKDIKIINRTHSGRVNKLIIIHAGGELEMTGHTLRMAVGPDIIKSALFTIGRSEEPFHFYGRGWGHGVGMCQWGARGQALQGKDFREILKYYMPGTEVRRWSY